MVPHRLLPPFLLALLSQTALAEPAQYCHDTVDPGGSGAFCLAVENYHNASTGEYDLHTRIIAPKPSARGWLAVGLGPFMASSLMFVIYGDPESDRGPTLSVRTSSGYILPHVVTKEEAPAMDVDLVSSRWVMADISGGRRVSADVALVCYACNRWTGTTISPTASSQPWVWSANLEQEMPDYGVDAAIRVHQANGFFYVDMARALVHGQPKPGALPTLDPALGDIAASKSPLKPSPPQSHDSSHKHTHPFLSPPTLHGLSMGLATLILFPIGIIAIRSGLADAFKYHWIFQALGALFVAVGVFAGFLASHGRYDSPHQRVGLVLLSTFGVQILLGWRHHVVFLRIRRRTWVSFLHIWLGRVGIVGAWGNLIGGVMFGGHTGTALAVVASLVSVEAVGLFCFLWVVARRKRIEGVAAKLNKDDDEVTARPRQGTSADSDFAVGSDDESDDGSNTEVEYRDSEEKEKSER